MIPLDKIRGLQHIVVHDNCADGSAAALILKDVLPKADVRFIQYNTPEHRTLEVRPGTIFADFSPHPDQADAFREVGAIVLDHHKDKRELVESFGELGVFGDEKTQPGISGAFLAYREVWLPTEGRTFDDEDEFPVFVRRLATLAGVYDTWMHKDPRWKEAYRQALVLKYMPHDLLIEFGLAYVHSHWASRFDWLGKILEEKDRVAVDRAIREGRRFTMATYADHPLHVLMFPNVILSSNTAEALDGDGETDLVVGFDVIFENGGPCKYLYSTRSHTGFDCSAFARANGGGGHTASAGFSVKDPTKDPLSTFTELLDAHLDERPKP